MDGKVFSSETKKKAREVLDEVIKLKGFKELLSDIGLFGVVEAVDYFGDKVIPDEFDTALNDAVSLAIEKDYEGAMEALADLLDSVIDIPVLDDAQEEFVFQQGMKFLIAIIKNWIVKQQEEEQPVEPVE